MIVPTWLYDDGGRAAAGFQGEAGDCVTRAIAIATGLPYQDVYGELHSRIAVFAGGRSRAAKRAARGGGRRGTTPRNGVFRDVWHPFLVELGWLWTPTMAIGRGCQVHLHSDDLPSGRLVVKVSRHVVAVIDGIIHDTHDCSRDGTRCVYGYFVKL
jgi:hypothetical protein